MGRGRQKAKQTKVARELKYYSPQTDYERLQRELGVPAAPEPETEDEATDDEPDEDHDSWAAPGRR